jgi:chemotaxis protein CheX
MAGIEECLEPFVSGVSVSFEVWANTVVVVQGISRQAPAGPCGDLAAVLKLQAGLDGSLVLHFPKPTAVALARRIFTDVTEEVDDMLVRDCLGEMANVVAGQAKALLSQTPHRFAFSTPTVVAEEELRMARPQECLTILFGSDLGGFTVQLSLGTQG